MTKQKKQILKERSGGNRVIKHPEDKKKETQRRKVRRAGKITVILSKALRPQAPVERTEGEAIVASRTGQIQRLAFGASYAKRLSQRARWACGVPNRTRNDYLGLPKELNPEGSKVHGALMGAKHIK